MTDEELIKSLRGWHMVEMDAAADRIAQLTNTHWQVEAMQQNALLHDALTRAETAEDKLAKAVEERDEALNQLDSARHSVDVLEIRLTDKMAKLAKALDALQLASAELLVIGVMGLHRTALPAANKAREVLAELEKEE